MAFSVLTHFRPLKLIDDEDRTLHAHVTAAMSERAHCHVPAKKRNGLREEARWSRRRAESSAVVAAAATEETKISRCSRKQQGPPLPDLA